LVETDDEEEKALETLIASTAPARAAQVAERIVERVIERVERTRERGKLPDRRMKFLLPMSAARTPGHPDVDVIVSREERYLLRKGYDEPPVARTGGGRAPASACRPVLTARARWR